MYPNCATALQKYGITEKDLEEIENQLQFVFTDNKIKIMFPPYTIACGACGVLKSEQNYTKD